jgi:AcrR family transcriptional regulator
MVHTMSTPPATTEKPLRRDAERNRQRILDAARIVFAERGLRASHDDIAREAGVGVGTVYRRFPEKEQLIDALFVERMDEIAALAETARAMDDPWEALVHFMVAGQELQCEDRGLKELALGEEAGRIERARDRVSPIVEEIFGRAQAAGAIRADVAFTDLPLIHLGVGAASDATREVAPEAWRRLLALTLDGLRATPDRATPLSAPPLGEEDLAVAMSSCGGPDRRR